MWKDDSFLCLSEGVGINRLGFGCRHWMLQYNVSTGIESFSSAYRHHRVHEMFTFDLLVTLKLVWSIPASSS